MLSSHVNSFRNDSVSDLLVNDHSNRSWVHIKNSSSPSMIVLEWHTFMGGTINNNVDNVSDSVGSEGFGDVDGTVLFESFFEFVSSFALISVAVSHVVKRIQTAWCHPHFQNPDYLQNRRHCRRCRRWGHP